MIGVDPVSGRILGARQCPSPNYDMRPEDCEIELIVIHNISLPPGQYGADYIDQLFTNCLDVGAHRYFQQLIALRVSSHALIRRHGELVQYVSLNDRAWHAGVSQFQGRNQCNDFSIGIELEGCDQEAYTAVQYQVLIDLIQRLLMVYPQLNSDCIVGHSDIAPGRKTDPGPAFDWHRLRSALSGQLR